MSEPNLLLGDVLAIAGTIAMTTSIAGMIRLPDLHVKILAASKALVLGVFVVLSASLATASADLILRAALVGGFLFLTAPAGAHALARVEAILRRDDFERDDSER
jgi:multicomponent Na+:H+ antiporter subunit G